ncbi:MAG TPA: BamA/TamA family outer membrane protein [Gemmatimonadaceae bacterium]|nr:BamA/TamA family outer membrane protein [Gemmatimonadaceae bacterium]
MIRPVILTVRLGAACAAAGAGLALSAGRAAAQHPGAIAPADSGACHGEIVRDIEVEPGTTPSGPLGGVWRVAQRMTGRQHALTQRSVILSFVAMRVGRPCTELERSESERVLRAQPFLAAASIRAAPDSAGGVRLLIATRDEIPLIVRGGLSGATLQSLALGDNNVRGSAVSAQAGFTLRDHYRTGLQLGLTSYAAFHRPIIASVYAERAALGSRFAASVRHPFNTDLQPAAWYAGVSHDNSYVAIARPANDGLALNVRQTRYDVSGLRRFRVGGLVAGLGGIVSGVRVRPAPAGTRITDLGLAPDTGLTLAGRYGPFGALRPGVIVGIRLVRFVRGTGFNSLAATEDLAQGFQIGLLAERGIGGFPDATNDVFYAGSLYAGRATPLWFVGLDVEAERRRNQDRRRWDDGILSGRLAWYVKAAPRTVFVMSDELSGGSQAILPFQLTLGGTGGVRGYRGSYLGGAWRNVIRAEERWTLGSPLSRMDFGLAAFADAGSLWAGDAPYGVTAPFRVSVGASVLGAVPRNSKRLIRVDLAVPTKHEGNRSWEVRFSIVDLTRAFWREPGDVSRSRLGPVPSSIMQWPAR